MLMKFSARRDPLCFYCLLVIGLLLLVTPPATLSATPSAIGQDFIGRVIDTLTMPTFDATLLALMGISSGTYIGFKLPNKQG